MEGSRIMKLTVKKANILLLLVVFIIIILLGACGGLVPLQIVSQPQSQVKLEGQTVTFSVSILGGIPPYNYQWKKDGVNIPGANSQSYTILDLKINHTGVYSVVVTDNSSPNQQSVVSGNANLVVISK